MSYYGLSEKGPVREKNEDSFDCRIINGCLCMMIADGLGGEVCGEVASRIAVETVMKLFENNPDALKDGEHMSEFLASVFNKANKEILRYENDHTECRGMCTTLTVAVQNDTKLYISHIGDTRAYLCHRREIQKLTIDHNKAAQLVKDPMDCDKILEDVGLKERHDNFPAQLSGGEQQRIAIARAIAKNPKLLLCDEPTGALDYQTGKAILKLLQTLSAERGMTVVIITHNSALTAMADRVIKVKNGRITSNELNKNPVPIDDIEW